ncbi:Uncharacterised protein [Chlamydia trachomatis]|nr:Uncharacterised protein [Chlamydia trachomatis]
MTQGTDLQRAAKCLFLGSQKAEEVPHMMLSISS